MSTTTQPVQTRNFFIDNLKGILIALVVIGHLNDYFATIDSNIISTISNFIYTFHMPMFLFCSGLFVKRSFAPGKKGQAANVIVYLLLYVAFRAASWGLDAAYGEFYDFNLMIIRSGAWYLFVLACFLVIAPLLNRMRFGWALAGALVLSLLNALFNTQEGFLSSSRLLTYLPFFVVGFYLTGDNFIKLKNSLCKTTSLRIVLPIISAAVLVGYFLSLYYLPSDIVQGIRLLSTGFHAFAGVDSFMGLSGGASVALMLVARLLWYALVAVIGIAIIILCPRGNTHILRISGERSLQIYIIHLLLCYWYDNLHINTLLDNAGMNVWVWGAVVPIVLGVGLTFLLALPPWPNRWVQSLRNVINRFVMVRT